MSSSSTATPELPKFKDKVMYFASNIDNRSAKSYQISASFQGIVRLSPNNHNTYREDSTYSISVQDELSGSALYSDAIKFDSDANSAIKSNSDITRRMIIASESTGFFVNFRISDKDVQFDNLGVIGITQTNHLTLFSTDNTETNSSFLLNGKRMPTRSSSTPNIPITDDNSLLIQFDQNEIKITQEGDGSQIIYTDIDTKGEQFFKYKNTQRFIRDAILQALLSLQTIPTGSVHFVPLTIDQYKALCSAQLPNKELSFDNNSINITDPIVRDFLLCDGRRYKNIDFPELAKVLWKQNIQCWKEPQIGGYLYPVENNSPYDDICAEQNNYEDSKTFRVPDLRHMYIGAVQAKGMDTLTCNEVQNHRSHYKAFTGKYITDCLPVYTEKYKPDTHKHFIAYGTYNQSLAEDDFKFHSNDVEGCIAVDRDTNRVKPLTSAKIGLYYLTNHPFAMEINTNGGCRGSGFGRRAAQMYCVGRCGPYHTGVDSIPAFMWSSIPMATQNKPKTQQTQAYRTQIASMGGISSIQMMSVYKNENDNDTLHGHENAPKSVYMIPLIKI